MTVHQKNVWSNISKVCSNMFHFDKRMFAMNSEAQSVLKIPKNVQDPYNGPNNFKLIVNNLDP